MKKLWILLVLFLVGCTQVKSEDVLESEGPVFVVVHKGEILLEIDPDVDKSYYFEGSEGPMIAEVEDGFIRLIESNCPEQLCVAQSWMGVEDRLPIICLPNEVMISSSTAMFN